MPRTATGGMEGTLTKQSVGGGMLSNWRKRWFVLPPEGDQLAYYTAAEAPHPKVCVQSLRQPSCSVACSA